LRVEPLEPPQIHAHSARALEPPMPKTIDQLLSEVRSRLARVKPQAAALQEDGALFVDIRPAVQRRSEGEIPGALIVERNVLEWRLDPASPHRLPEVTGYDQAIVVICSEGYASSLRATAIVSRAG
jgi:rhodanese-related sulfurtransferase